MLTVLKTAARTISKALAGAGAAMAVEEKAEGWGSVVGAVGRVAADLSEQADLRISRYFPGSAHVGGINLDPGVYSITVNYYGPLGLIASDKQDNIIVQANKLNLAEFICLR